MAIETPPPIARMRHPQYVRGFDDWNKWRLTYEGGRRFKHRYLERLGPRETDEDFARRRNMTPVPAFAKGAVNEVRNSVFQRMGDITRQGGPKSYQQAVNGVKGGVDLVGSTMNAFIGRDILPELLTMSRVGVYVDMPRIDSFTTIIQKGQKRPYLYWYKIEDILAWSVSPNWTSDPTEFTGLLLQDSIYDCDDQYALAYGSSNRYRFLWIDEEDGRVHCKFYNEDSEEIWPYSEEGQEIILPIKRIPFVMFEISDSLLCDISDYQIALLNLGSSDINYALTSNTPFYVEQFDWRSAPEFYKPQGPGGQVGTAATQFDAATGVSYVSQEKVTEIKYGASGGRRYAIGTDQPAFINPSAEPLKISMEKQEQLKRDIKDLIQLAVSNIGPSRASAESKTLDNQSLETGLSYIGLELEHGERKIADYWAMYEGDATPATVNYPEQYSLMSIEDRQLQAKVLQELMPMVPSITFRRSAAKLISKLILETRVSDADTKKINTEIDADPVVIGDPDVIEKDVESGLCDPETASLARGYPPGTAAKAKVAQAEKLAMIAEHQAKPNLAPGSSNPDARGLPSGDPKGAKKEKTESQSPRPTDPTPTKRTRGEGK